MRSARAMVPAVLLGVLLLGGCQLWSGQNYAKASGTVLWSLGADGADYYLRTTTKVTRAWGGLEVRRDIYPPFRWEVTVGAYEGTPESGLKQLATAIGNRNSPGDYWVAGAEQVEGGMNVFAVDNLTSSWQGEQVIAGATRVDLAIEHDGADVTFYARAHGSPDWIEIHSSSAGTFTAPFVPRLSVFDLQPGGVGGFDGFRVVESGVPTEPVTFEYQAALDSWKAVDDLVEALHLSDGDMPDAAAAGVHVADAILDLDNAIAGLASPVKAKGGSADTARKLLGKAKKASASVAKKLAKGKTGKSAVKGLMKASQIALTAADVLTTGPG